MFTRPVDKVPHNKQVTRHVHVADTVQFLVHALAHIGFMGRELEVLFREAPLEALITKMGNVDIRIRARFAPAMDSLVPGLVVIFIKEFRLRQTFNFSLVVIGQGIGFNSLFGAIGFLHLFLLILDDALEFTFANYRIFRIVFRLHDGFDALVFFRCQEFVRNLETGPEFVADTGLDRIVTAFRNLHRIFDGSRNMTEQFHHFGFATEIEFVRRETLIVKTVQGFFQRNATQNLVGLGIFSLDVMYICHRHDFTAQLARQLNVIFVQ